jgi:hypothetical protein
VSPRPRPAIAALLSVSISQRLEADSRPAGTIAANRPEDVSGAAVMREELIYSMKRNFPMTDRGQCVFCESEITKGNDSSEHVIPNSIGGRKKVRGFLCRTCNNSLGQSWDAKLAAQLNWFSLSIGIERERGSNPEETVRTVDGTELRLKADGTMTRKESFFQVTESDGIASIRMFARTEREAHKMLYCIKKKYPKFDLEGELRNLRLTPYKVESALQHRLE